MRGGLIAVFVSTHETLRAERAFKKAKIKVRATIKPRKISSSCQMAIAFPAEQKDDIERVVKKESLSLTGLYKQDSDGNWIEA